MSKAQVLSAGAIALTFALPRVARVVWRRLARRQSAPPDHRSTRRAVGRRRPVA